MAECLCDEEPARTLPISGALTVQEAGDLIGQVFRTMPLIKGPGAMFGFDRIARFTHEIETAHNRVRSGRVPGSKEITSLILKTREAIREMLGDPSEEGPEHPLSTQFASAFRRLAGAEDERVETPPPGAALLRRRQTVIKNAGRLYGNAEDSSGATIPGDGTAAPIMRMSAKSATGMEAAPAIAETIQNRNHMRRDL